MSTMHTASDTTRAIAAAAGQSTNLRAIEGIYRAPGLHWVGDGFRVRGYFSSIPDAVAKLNPFLLLDYHPAYDYAPTERPRGVGVHPHRGFETVTIAWEGSVAHHDSTGSGGVIGPGDMQWMTAASGILHKEYHEREFARRGGTFHMAQLWVNLPKAHKMGPPRYQSITADRMGVVTLPDGAGSVRVLAGEYRGVAGPARTFTPINVFDVRLNSSGSADFAIPVAHNAGLLVLEGAVTINGAKAVRENFVVFENEGESVHIEAASEAQLLFLSGEPIDDPIVQYGPFVMNTEREILQAFADYNAGKFGHLDD
jgi:quercetin 2,3-dioxygenase